MNYDTMFYKFVEVLRDSTQAQLEANAKIWKAVESFFAFK